MSDLKIPLKNPWTAGILAFLIPGAGHLYQGRTFKGGLYLVCILGTFFYGMHLGEWGVVYYRAEPGNRTWGYYFQVLVGLPALPALVQARRYNHRDNTPQTTLPNSISAPFSGILIRYDADRHAPFSEISGRVSLEQMPGPLGPEIRGVFTGTRAEEQEIELQLGGPLELDRPIFADPGRGFRCEVFDENGNQIGRIEGVIPRSFRNWFQVPLEERPPRDLYGRTLQDLHGRLGKFLELALVYTWIAGLLNLLAIWDAVEGPAYGYGDEQDESTDRKKPDAESQKLEKPAEKEAPDRSEFASSKPPPEKQATAEETPHRAEPPAVERRPDSPSPTSESPNTTPEN